MMTGNLLVPGSQLVSCWDSEFLLNLFDGHAARPASMLREGMINRKSETGSECDYGSEGSAGHAILKFDSHRTCVLLT